MNKREFSRLVTGVVVVLSILCMIIFIVIFAPKMEYSELGILMGLYFNFLLNIYQLSNNKQDNKKNNSDSVIINEYDENNFQQKIIFNNKTIEITIKVSDLDNTRNIHIEINNKEQNILKEEDKLSEESRDKKDLS